MQTTLFSTIFTLTIVSLASAQGFTSGSSFEADEKTRFETSIPLVSYDYCPCHSGGSSGSTVVVVETTTESELLSSTSSGSGEGSGGEGSGGEGGSGPWKEGEYCFLLSILLNYSYTLEVQYQSIFIQWINETQINIVQDQSLTEYQILVEIWYSLSAFLEINYEIESIVKYWYIESGSFSWGYVFNLEGLAIEIQSNSSCTEISVEEVITLEGENGTCPLFVSLEDWCSNEEETAAVEDLIAELTIIIESGVEFSIQLTQIYVKIEAFFSAHVEWKASIISFQIEGFGSIGSFYDICATYWRIQNFEIAVGGSVEECALIQALISCYQNESSGLSTGERSDIKGFTDKISQYFTSNTDVQVRISYFSQQLYQLFILEQWTVKTIYSIEISAEYGSIWQLIYAFIYQQNNGIDFGSGSETTVAAVTTPAVEPPTTVPSGNCGTVTTVNTYTSSTNTTVLLTSIDSAQTTWERSEVNQFSGYKKRIYNISINQTATESQIFEGIKTIFLNFASSTTVIYQKVQSIEIQSWGTVKEYCGCSV
ncbi:hypothetical protein M3Y95_01289600 [Aphelenchoides besseyi]|nr:hypothetical protein M3Y95_01289600 [Aphelenchoides besseyi]